MAVQPAACRDGGQTRQKQGEREGARHVPARPAELGFHRREVDGEGVVQDAPRDGLGDAEDPDEDPPVIDATSACASLRLNRQKTSLDKREAELSIRRAVTARNSSAGEPSEFR